MQTILRKAFSTDGEISIKRIIGVLGVLFYIGSIMASFLGEIISTIQEDLLLNLLYACCGLLGIGVLDGLGTSRGRASSNTYMGSNSSNTIIDNPKQMEENK